MAGKEKKNKMICPRCGEKFIDFVRRVSAEKGKDLAEKEFDILQAERLCPKCASRPQNLSK